MALRNQDEIFVTQEEIPEACRGELHASALKGIELFDRRQYWHAHEALEEAWLAEEGPVRHLYKGILQAGVTYLQIERANFVGMAKMHERCKKWLKPWPEHCRGLDIGQLRRDVAAAVAAAGRLGPDNLDQFDESLYKKIKRLE